MSAAEETETPPAEVSPARVHSACTTAGIQIVLFIPAVHISLGAALSRGSRIFPRGEETGAVVAVAALWVFTFQFVGSLFYLSRLWKSAAPADLAATRKAQRAFWASVFLAVTASHWFPLGWAVGEWIYRRAGS